MAKKIRIMKVMSIGQNVELGWEAEAADLNLGNQSLDQVKELGTQAQGEEKRVGSPRAAPPFRPVL